MNKNLFDKNYIKSHISDFNKKRLKTGELLLSCPACKGKVEKTFDGRGLVNLSKPFACDSRIDGGECVKCKKKYAIHYIGELLNTERIVYDSDVYNNEKCFI